MTTSVMRAELLAYLADADDKKIKGLYSLLEGTMHEKRSVTLTREESAIVNEERRKYMNGEGRSYDWNEVKDMIRKRKAS